MLRNRTPRRRGSIYVVVLGTSTVVTVVGLSALMAMRVERRSAEGLGDFAQARMHARSAIELGIWQIGVDSNWRGRTSGVWETNKPIGTGSLALSVEDPLDGDLGDDSRDGLVLTGTGWEGDARFKLEVLLEAVPQPLSCLEVSAHADNDIVVLDSATVSGDQIISANDTIEADGVVSVAPDMESVNGFSGALGPGQTTSGVAPRDLPNPATVFDYYLAKGTYISIWSLPKWDEADQEFDVVEGVPTIRRELLSPSSNPFGGGTNSEGIYIIDAQGETLDIEDSRIVGTLVILNAAWGSVIRGSVNWEPAVPNYPALMSNDELNLAMTSAPLSEATTGRNFNPVGSGVGGAEDSTLDDSYSSVIKGIVYSVGDIAISNSVWIDGVLVAGNTLTISGGLTVTYQQAHLDDPPPGFIDTAPMVVVAGSWKQLIN